MFGKLLSYEILKNKISLFFEKQTAYVTIVTPEIINFYTAKKHSFSIERKIKINPTFDINRTETELIITTIKLKIVIKDNFKIDIYKDNILLASDYEENRLPFKRMDISFEKLDTLVTDISEKEGHKSETIKNFHKIEIIKKSFNDEYIYGLGEKTGFLNKKYYEYENWNTDDPSTHTEYFKSLYKSIPFFIVKRPLASYGIFFDNTSRTYYDFMKENSNYYYFAADYGTLDYYFISGDDLKKIVKNYSYLTGSTPLPRRKSLGHHQSRWSYGTKKTVDTIISHYKKNQIPLDFIHLDIDYMDNYKVFTIDQKRFPDFKNYVLEKNKSGLDIITIIDPGVKVENNYFMYEEAIKNKLVATQNNKTYINQVWPGDSIYPDFSNPKTQKWWKEKQKILTSNNIFGVWNDMNEPASFKGALPDDVKFHKGFHTEIHNVYGHLMAKATYEGLKQATNKRPFVITRACFAGSQKYTTFWTGDNQSLWLHLEMAIPMLANMGLSGLAFTGTDIGGFGSDTTKELLIRWYQVGVFSPLFRNHASMKTRNQEPFAFDDETTKIIKKFVQLRYQLIPYFYDLFYKHQINCLPPFRPLVLNYPEDEKTFELNDQFMLGDNILVSPIINQGKTDRTTYLPKSKWYGVLENKIFSGEKTIISNAKLDECPIYLKTGTILPLYPIMQNLKSEPDLLRILFIPGKSNYEHYIDDGTSFDYKKGIYSLISLKGNLNSLSSLIKKDNYKIPYQNIEIYIYTKSTNIFLNDEIYHFEKIKDFVLIKTKSLNFKVTF